MRGLKTLLLAAAFSGAACQTWAWAEPAKAAPRPLASSAIASAGASQDALRVERWIRARADNHGLPYAIVDKKAARIYVMRPDGTLAGASNAILGSARGDTPIPGAGKKNPNALLPIERRTPSGRFLSKPGANLAGEKVVWVDYDTGIALHRVRPGRTQATRDMSLAKSPDDRRLSLGCVVAPESFYLSTVLPALGHGRAVIYILPEDGPVEAMLAHPEPART